jgi:sn-glycerol 3-phosphate transport system substrate-binding protein
MTRAFAEAGVELGVTLFPTYNAENRVSEIGGANISIVGADNSEEEIKASWEFIKFILEDEQQFFNAKTSGYIAITKSIAEYEGMTSFWAENPEFKVGYDQALTAGRGQETPYNPVMQDYTQIIWDNVSLLIGEQSITPEEAVANVKAESADLWG